jgi:hypothetical protein
MIVYENHVTYDYVHENEPKCVACPKKKPHNRIPGAFFCRGDCPK